MKILLFLITFQAFAQDDVIWIPRNESTIINQPKKESEFQPFINDLKEFIKNDELNQKIDQVKIRLLDEDEPQDFYGNAICDIKTKTIRITRLKWLTSNQNEKQQLIDHELGHCAFGMIHTSKETIMNPKGFDYKSNDNKSHFRKDLLNLKNHNKIKILNEKIKNIQDLKIVQKIEDSLNE